MSQTAIGWARGIVIAVTAAATVAVTISGGHVYVPLGVGALLLFVLNRYREDPEGDAYTRALRRQLIGIAVVGLAAVAFGVAALSGLLDGRGSTVAGLLIVGSGVGFILTAWTARRYLDPDYEPVESKSSKARITTPQRRNTHWTRAVEALQGQYCCPTCGWRFYTQRGVDEHRLTHGEHAPRNTS